MMSGKTSETVGGMQVRPLPVPFTKTGDGLVDVTTHQVLNAGLPLK